MSIKDINLSECLKRNAKRRKRNARKLYTPFEKPDWFEDRYSKRNIIGFKCFLSDKYENNKIHLMLNPFVLNAAGWGGKVSFLRNYSSRLIDLNFVLSVFSLMLFLVGLVFLVAFPHKVGVRFDGIGLGSEFSLILIFLMIALIIYLVVFSVSGIAYIVIVRARSMINCIKKENNMKGRLNRYK